MRIALLGKKTRTETVDIKRMLSPEQQQLFDQVFRRGWRVLFPDAQVTAVGVLGGGGE